MKVLENLDESASDTSLSENLPSPNKPVKATKPVTSMVQKSTEVMNVLNIDDLFLILVMLQLQL